MEKVYYILGSLAAIVLLIATPVLTIRALLLMARLEDMRRGLSELTIEAGMSVRQANRFLARSQETMDQLRHAIERMEHILTLLQPMAAVSGLFSGARRSTSGRHAPEETTSTSKKSEGEHHDK